MLHICFSGRNQLLLLLLHLAIVGFVQIGTSSTVAAASCRSGSKISHSAAWAMCQAAGGFQIWSSTGRIGCRQRGCTSLEQVRCDTMLGIVAFKRASGCSIIITGGTEEGHASGTYSHYNGYKLDISLSDCVNKYVYANYPYSYTRGDGAKVYVDGRRNEYALESNHWDILYKS